MQGRKFPGIALILSFFLAMVSLRAQTMEIDDLGHKKIVYADGSWRFYDENNPEDAQLFNRLSNSETAPELASMYRELLDIGNKIQYNNKWLEEVQMNIVEVENQLFVSYNEKDLYSKDQINALNVQFKELKDREKNLKKSIHTILTDKKEIENRIGKISKTKERSGSTASDVLTAAPAEGDNITSETPVAYENSAVYQPDIQPRKEEKIPFDKKAFASYDPLKDVMVNPPVENCNIAFEGVDEFSGKRRVDLLQEVFFEYTDEELRNYIRDKEYITCLAQMSKFDNGIYYLLLNIVINSKEAQKSFGLIEKGSVLTIKFIDNTSIRLIDTKSSTGTIDSYKGTTTYNAQFQVSDSDLKKLKDSEIDKIRVNWSTGFEDYPIYDVALLMRQVQCLTAN